MRKTTCLYCEETGSVIPLKFSPAQDLHAHNCGTTMLIDRATGEVLATRRHYWCTRWDTLKAEMHALSTQVRDLIHQRDSEGVPHADDPY